MLLKYLSKKILQENLPKVNEKRCINFYGKTHRCTICRDMCPVDAIVINNKSITIDDQLCKQCSICKVTCPSQAIDLKTNEEIKLIRELGEKETMVIGCSRQGNEGNIVFSCIHGLHKEYLVALLIALKNKKIYFNLCQCSNCHITSKNNYFENSLHSAITFINHFNINTDIELLFHEEDIPQYKDQTISRRDLFTFLKKRSTNMAIDVVSDVIGKENYFIPRDFILSYIDSLTNKSTEDIKIPKEESILTNWQVKDSCNCCGFCQTLCPSKAWKIEKQKEYMTINHSARRCTSCSLCADLCPEKALEKDTFSTDLLKGFIIKKQILLSKCRKCTKEYIRHKNDIGLCQICEKRNLVKQSILRI